jgi:hypothetical protein
LYDEPVEVDQFDRADINVGSISNEIALILTKLETKRRKEFFTELFELDKVGEANKNPLKANRIRPSAL